MQSITMYNKGVEESMLVRTFRLTMQFRTLSITEAKIVKRLEIFPEKCSRDGS